MNKRTGMKVLSGIGVLIGLVIIGWIAFGVDEVRLTQDRIQGLVDEQLPFESDDITVENATVGFSGNSVVVNTDVSGSRLGQQFSLSAATIGVPSYRGGSFYFVPSDIELQNVVIGEADSPSITDRLIGAAERYLPNNEGARNLVTDLAPGMETWLTSQTLRVAERVLSQVPVYTLPSDTKGLAAKAVLDEVFVENNELVITFTLWRLTWTVLMGVVLVIASFGLAIAMMRNPGLFLAISVIPGDF